MHKKNKKKTISTEKPATTLPNTNEKFAQFQNEQLEKAKQFIDKYESSSEEEDLNEDDIISQVFRNYSSDSNQTLKTRTFLENFFQSGSAICLICIGTVKRQQSVWSCKNCFCFFHFDCLKRWANDSIAQQKINVDQEQGYYNNQGEFIQKKIKSIRWCCPKCRCDYTPDKIPRFYQCFCEKEINPPFHPWLIPHSCGEKCEKYLQPECGHKCLLLCHPGPCPPCPQNIIISCKCNKSQKKTIRCFQKSWSCESKCENILACGIHKCNKVCHDKGKCPPCMKLSKQPCQCGSEISERNCSQSMWQCKKVCNKPLTCGLHKCKKVCHFEECGDCPLGLPRACPCGKTKSVAPCSEVIDTCGDTCQKTLSCGLHNCAQRCHKGDCSLCLVIVEKKCRCGIHKKELPCSKTFTCETKCKLIKDCGKHICNKKCCDGECPPCDKICGKMLSCKKHKCKSICHEGPCYPCDIKSTVKCRCGNTSIKVPCGREKKTRAPKCNQPCRIASKCHHNNPHRCHMLDCPTCVQKCNLKNDTTNCEHLCEAKCHDAVKIEIKQPKTVSIWEWQPDTVEFKKMPHPSCEIKVMVACIGGHEVSEWPCWNSKPSSCQRICNRILKCSNHTCQKVCHTVSNLEDQNEQESCTPCNEQCKIPRANGCMHPCKKQCHPSPCELCNTNIKTNCHCGLTLVYYKCNEFFAEKLSGNELKQKQEQLKSCGNRCIKNYSCNHRCISICHSGSCPNPESCRKKVKIYCICKNLKIDISCEKYRNGMVLIPCDDSCIIKKANENSLNQEEEERQRKIEEEKNRLEVEQFEKKFGKKKYRERKTVDRQPESNSNLKIIALGAAIGILAIILTIYLCY